MVRDDRPPMGLEGTSPPPEMADDAYGYVGSPGSPSPGREAPAPARGVSPSPPPRRRPPPSAAAARPRRAPPGGGGGGGEHTNGYYEVYPRGGGRKPALLVQLESLLAEQLRLSEKLASVKGGIHGADYRDESGALALEAHRAVFDAFINAFTTYRPLLTKVKEHYDRALDRALRSEHECADALRAQGDGAAEGEGGGDGARGGDRDRGDLPRGRAAAARQTDGARGGGGEGTGRG